MKPKKKKSNPSKEKQFKRLLVGKYKTQISFLDSSKIRFAEPKKVSKKYCEVRFDFGLRKGRKTILFEIHAGTSHKSLVGEYVLANTLAPNKNRYSIVIISYKTNPERVREYLGLTNKTLYKNAGIEYRVFSDNDLAALVKREPTLKSLLNSLVK